MLSNSIKKITLIFSIAFLISPYIAHAEENKSICEFSKYDGDIGAKKVNDAMSSTFIEEAFYVENPNFEKLNNLINSLNIQDCKFADGRQTISFIFGFDEVFQTIKDKELLLKKIAILKKTYPKSAYPIIIEAQYWMAYASLARGTGFASTVTPEGWKLFHERLLKAEAVLLDNKKIGSEHPNWYVFMLNIEQDLDRDEKIRQQIIAEGFNRYSDYLPLYIAYRNRLEPKWGGSWKAVDQFINWSTENTKSTYGHSMYSRLYIGVFKNRLKDVDFFKDTLIDWSKLKEGFDDLIRLTPNSQSNLNIYALMACEADDKVTYLKVRSKILQFTDWYSWRPHNLVFDCDKKYGYQKNL